MSPEPAAPSILGTPFVQPIPLTYVPGTAPYFPPGPGAAARPQPLLADVYLESTEKSWAVTLLLSIFFGMFGADRFYLGKRDTAIKKAVTLGGFGMWWVADILFTAFGGQRDYAGLPLAGYHKHRATAGWVALGFFAWPIVLGGLMVLARAVVGDMSTVYSPTALGRARVGEPGPDDRGCRPTAKGHSPRPHPPLSVRRGARSRRGRPTSASGLCRRHTNPASGASGAKSGGRGGRARVTRRALGRSRSS